MPSTPYAINDTGFYGLLDCNAFFVSCEIAFAPHLRGKPVGVLSNNDGCLVALSQELKALGVTRGMPAFKIREIVGEQKVHLFSSNYELYGDMSSRVMRIVSSMVDDIEVYSIDEAFLYLNDIHSSINLTDYLRTIRERVLRETGIPVSIGLAKTKTLAKLANTKAKKHPTGIFELTDHALSTDKLCLVSTILEQTPVEDIWGIGRQHKKILNKHFIWTAADFIKRPVHFVRKAMSVTGERTYLELQGIPCIEMEQAPPKPQSIVCSRSFGKPVTDFEQLSASVSTYTSKALNSLRKKGQVARCISVFITTNPFKDTQQYANYLSGSLKDFSAYTPDFIALALSLLKKIYRSGYQYKKSGVMLTDMKPQDMINPTLFDIPYGSDHRHLVMKAIDDINNKFGKETISFASNSTKKGWEMRREFTSPRYTTRWNELLVVR